MNDQPICPRCNNQAARISPLFGVLICEKCVAGDRKDRKTGKSAEFSTQTQADRIQNQRDAHEKDMLPPTTHEGKPSEEFARAYPDKAEQVKKDYEEVSGELFNW